MPYDPDLQPIIDELRASITGHNQAVAELEGWVDALQSAVASHGARLRALEAAEPVPDPVPPPPPPVPEPVPVPPVPPPAPGRATIDGQGARLVVRTRDLRDRIVVNTGVVLGAYDVISVYLDDGGVVDNCYIDAAGQGIFCAAAGTVRRTRIDGWGGINGYALHAIYLREGLLEDVTVGPRVGTIGFSLHGYASGRGIGPLTIRRFRDEAAAPALIGGPYLPVDQLVIDGLVKDTHQLQLGYGQSVQNGTGRCTGLDVWDLQIDGNWRSLVLQGRVRGELSRHGGPWPAGGVPGVDISGLRRG